MCREGIILRVINVTVLQEPIKTISQDAKNALIDRLRSCSTTKEILDFENWFNRNGSNGQLHDFICELLKSRSISRGIAAKWLKVLINDKEEKLKRFK
tara:strand:- start:440 stop:733 length:294 start_codon:yes stop_codon:yes gene_type:complete